MINETPWVTYKSPWLTVVETALVARCGRRLIYREVKAGRLRAARIGLLRRNLRIHVKGGAKLDHDGGGKLDHLAAGRSV